MTSPFDLNLRHLEAAAAVARLGGVSAAADTVNLSQPALTQGLAKLEARLGHRLFDRHSAGASPTAAGRLLALRVERALNLLADGVRQVRRGLRLPPLGPVARQVTMTQLRALIGVDQAGSYVAAAREAGVSQPSLHHAVRELEGLLGAPMLAREGRAVRPTLAAARFLRPARLALSELQAALDELTALETGGAGRLVIGAMPLARAALLPSTLARFSASRPAARIRVVEGPYPELLAGLLNGDIDCLIGALRSPRPDPDVEQSPLFVDRLFVVAGAGHPLDGAASAEQLARHPWVMSSPTAPLFSRWGAMFSSAGLAAPPVQVECGSVMAIRGLLLAGDWLTVLSEDQFRLEESAGLLKRIGGPISNSERSIGLTTRADWRPTALQADFLTELRGEVMRTRPQEFQ